MSDPKDIFSPNDRMLRQFAGIWILFFGTVAWRQQFQHNRPVVAMVIAVAAVVVGLTGLVSPQRIRPVFVGWMKAAYPIGWVVSRVVLGIIFYGVFTPVAFVLRLVGRDALVLHPQPSATTYWHTKPTSADKTNYLRQY